MNIANKKTTQNSSARSKWRKRFKLAFVSCFVFASWSWAGFEVLVLNCEPDWDLYKTAPEALAVFDCEGRHLASRCSTEQNWFFARELQEISPDVQQALIVTEDRRFYQHSGVDWKRMLRANVDNVLAMRPISGASTLSMQVVRMAEKMKTRTPWGKLKQMATAVALGRQIPKEWILEQWLNRANFGGNIIGIEAASQAYFGKSANKLNYYESALLAGLPQAPGRFHPLRNPNSIEKRFEIVNQRLQSQGFEPADWNLAQASLEKARRLSSGHNRLGWKTREALAIHYLPKGIKSGMHQLAINSEMQNRLRQILKTHAAASHCDAALIILERDSGKIVARIGNLHKSSPEAAVDVTRSRRSSGSTLKPFIYLQALQRGFILPESLLLDLPVNLPDWRPGNFSGTWRGQVSATEALQTSLNAPAVRLLHKCGLEPCADLLQSFGFRRPDTKRSGLSLALGGSEITPMELVHAWRLLHSGIGSTPLIKGEENIPSAAQRLLLLKMLSKQAPPCASDMRLAWKTGTSSGWRDSWAVASDQKHCAVAWFGHKDGRGSSHFVGATLALPALCDALRQVGHLPLQLPQTSPYIKEVKICSRCGLAHSHDSPGFANAQKAAGTPLASCACKELETLAQRLQILSPLPAKYSLRGKNSLTLQIKANRKHNSSQLHWFLNGKSLAQKSIAFELKLSSGHYRLSVTDELDHEHSIKFQVQ